MMPDRQLLAFVAILLGMGTMADAAPSPVGVTGGPASRPAPVPSTAAASRDAERVEPTRASQDDRTPAPIKDTVSTGRRVSLEADDGTRGAAFYHTPRLRPATPMPMVLLLDGLGDVRTRPMLLVRPLVDAGLAVLAMNLGSRGERGTPAGRERNPPRYDRAARLFACMRRDVTAAYLWMRDRPETDPARFAIVGAGPGFAVAMDYAVRDRSVDAVVGLAPVMEVPGLDTRADLGRYGNRPLMLITDDSRQTWVEKLAASAPAVTIEVLSNPNLSRPDGPPGIRSNGRLKGIERRIVEFLTQALGPPVGNACVVASIRGQVFYEPGSSRARRLSPANLRWFSSPAEAEARGLRPARSNRRRAGIGPGR